jgi:hypothetical protein
MMFLNQLQIHHDLLILNISCPSLLAPIEYQI